MTAPRRPLGSSLRRARLLALIRRNAALGLPGVTLTDHMERTGIASKNTAQTDFKALERAGEITSMPRRQRSAAPTRPVRIEYFRLNEAGVLEAMR